jgi:hypothetical protein
MSADKGNLPVKISGFGCAGCGTLIGLAGLGAWALILTEQVSRYDLDEWMATGGALCCTGVVVLVFGAALVFFGRAKKTPAAGGAPPPAGGQYPPG